MIKALLLVFNPAQTWEKIEQDTHPVAKVFFLFFLPLLLLSAAGEAWGLIKLSREQGLLDRISTYAPPLVLRYELLQAGATLVILFGGAWMFQIIGASFHRRHSYAECFATLGYSLGPLLLVRTLGGLPFLNSWVCWGVGIFLAVASLYRGIPRLMKPDPSSAIGLYLFCSVLLVAVTGVANFFADLVLDGKILKFQSVLLNLGRAAFPS